MQGLSVVNKTFVHEDFIAVVVHCGGFRRGSAVPAVISVAECILNGVMGDAKSGQLSSIAHDERTREAKWNWVSAGEDERT